MPRASRTDRPGAPKGRRSQAERTAQTRAKIIAAVIDLIAERGFARTTAQEICARAGITWGAVQHHFGDKDGILSAVLEASFDQFAARIARTPVDGVSLEKRVAGFVDRAWEHYSSRHYRTTFEIILNLDAADSDGDGPKWQRRMYEAWNTVWIGVFPDARPNRRTEYLIQHYTLSTLSGLAISLMLEGDDARLPREELEFLKKTILDVLSSA